jgi:hypothetical protein
MTAKQIESRFDNEWILLGDPETDESLEVSKGKLLCHSKDRDEVYRRAVGLRPKRYAIIYTGTMPENTAVVL